MDHDPKHRKRMQDAHVRLEGGMQDCGAVNWRCACVCVRVCVCARVGVYMCVLRRQTM